MEHKDLSKLEIYNIAKDLSLKSWTFYNGLEKTHQFGIGKQFLSSTDSIGANIAEGFGRYHYKYSLKFYYNARGSLFEVKHWISLLNSRKLISQSEYAEFSETLNILGIKLNKFISFLRSKS